jgi:hypothetical protein
LSPVGDVASAVENVSAAYSDTTVAPHEYFDQTASSNRPSGKSEPAGQQQQARTGVAVAVRPA